MSKLQE